jgi:hypothetical protein
MSFGKNNTSTVGGYFQFEKLENTLKEKRRS